MVNALNLSPEPILITLVHKTCQLLWHFVPHTGALPLDPTGELPSSRPSILDPQLAKPAYAPAKLGGNVW